MLVLVKFRAIEMALYVIFGMIVLLELLVFSAEMLESPTESIFFGI